jgi:hypothetical protein
MRYKLLKVRERHRALANGKKLQYRMGSGFYRGKPSTDTWQDLYPGHCDDAGLIISRSWQFRIKPKEVKAS